VFIVPCDRSSLGATVINFFVKNETYIYIIMSRRRHGCRRGCRRGYGGYPYGGYGYGGYGGYGYGGLLGLYGRYSSPLFW